MNENVLLFSVLNCQNTIKIKQRVEACPIATCTVTDLQLIISRDIIGFISNLYCVSIYSYIKS